MESSLGNTHLPGAPGETIVLALKVGSPGKDSSHKRDLASKLNPINHSLRLRLQAQMEPYYIWWQRFSQSKTGSMLLGTPPHGVPRNTAFIPQCLAHHTSCSIAAPIVEAFRLALAAAEAAMCMLTNKGFYNTQHLEGGKPALIVTGMTLWAWADTLSMGSVSLCPLLPASSWLFYS